MNDGQQRLVTTTLIFARLAHKMGRGRSKATVALRSRLYNLCFNDFQVTNLPGPNELLRSDLDPRITAPSEDISTFGKLLRKMDLAGDTKLVRAWQKIDEWLCEPHRDANRWRDRYARYFLNKITMVRLEVPDNFDLHAIFETLNSRGKPLEEIDLLKNYCLHRVSGCDQHTIDMVRFSFSEMESQLRRKKIITEYVRCHMQAKFGYIPEKNMFRNIRTAIEIKLGKSSNNRNFAALIGQLGSDYIRMYEMYKRPDNFSSELERFVGKVRIGKQRDLVTCLRELSRYSVVFPVLYSLFTSFLDTNVIQPIILVKSCRILSAFLIRVSLARNAVKPSLFEEDFAKLGKKIYDNPSRVIKDVINTVSELDTKGSVESVIKDPVFIEKIATLTSRSVPKCKLLLGAMEKESGTINAQHISESSVYPILPTNHSMWKNWNRFHNNHDVWCHRIGNKVLVENHIHKQLRMASKSANKKTDEFENIKDLLATSNFNFTKEISKMHQWDPSTIANRQLKVVDKVVKVWRVKP